VRNVLGCAAFLTVLRTRRISRSLPLIPQRIPASPAVVSAAAAPRHTHTQQTRACSVLHPPSHTGHGNTLEESCCRTCRRLRAKYGRRPQTVDRRDGRDSPRRTGSARAVAPRTKIAVGRRRATAGGPPGDTAPRAGYCPSPPRAPGPWSWATAPPSIGYCSEKTRQAGERLRRGRARRIRADGTISGPAVGHRD
jgi:hypothetical protein